MLSTLPMAKDINKASGKTVVRALMSKHSDPADRNFSRKSAPQETLDTSFLEVMRLLGANGIAVPTAFEKNDPLINLAAGHGYVTGNPNPAGMGLVTSRRRLALATTWADAPAWVVVYVDPENPDLRVIASGSGIWQYLPFNTPQQTVALIQSEVERLGGKFDIRNLWVTTSPGARAKGNWPFRLDEKGVGIALSGASAAHPDVIIELVNPAQEPGREGKPIRKYALDLSGLVRYHWLDQGIDPRKFFFNKKTNAKVSLANKRASDAAGQKTWPSEVIAISLV